jgi:hypothetical protein
LLRELDASVGASGPHDFAVRVGVARQRVTKASTASRLNVRDDREAPLLIEAGHGQATTISDFQKEKYFCGQDWTTQISLKGLMKSRFTRTRFCAFGASGEVTSGEN